MAPPEHLARGPAQKMNCVIIQIRTLENNQRFFGQVVTRPWISKSFRANQVPGSNPMQGFARIMMSPLAVKLSRSKMEDIAEMRMAGWILPRKAIFQAWVSTSLRLEGKTCCGALRFNVQRTLSYSVTTYHFGVTSIFFFFVFFCS